MPLPDRLTFPSKLSARNRRVLQRALNDFFERIGADLVAPLVVDGHIGPATQDRIRRAKWLLGYNAPFRKSTAVDQQFVWRMEHPNYVREGNNRARDRELVERGRERREARRRAERRTKRRQRESGLAMFDGKPVAAWFVPHLNFARANGWDGQLNSGWRDPEHSERLCFEICDAPTCPGRCAGRGSSHSQKGHGNGAIDVSRPDQFGALMRRSPHSPRIKNELGARDPWHFSVSGR